MLKVIRSFSTTRLARNSSIADVTIIGAGPAGFSLGAALKNSSATNHLQIKIIESLNLTKPLEQFYAAPPQQIGNRVVSLTPQSIAHFQSIGSWSHMKHERIQSYDEMVIMDGVSGAKLELQHDDIATMAETVNIQSSLYQRIKELGPGIDIIDNTKVVSITSPQADLENPNPNPWPELQLSNGDKVKTRLLVGCDGANSPVRSYANIDKRGWSYEKWGVVATLQNEFDSFKLPTAWQRFLPTGPIALLPLPDTQASLVWSTTPEISNALLTVDGHSFVKLINAAFRLDQDEMSFLYEMLLSNDPGLEAALDWRLAQFNKNKTMEELDSYPIPLISFNENSRAKFPLRLSHADTYVSSRVALVGDAAHTVHPLAGQGLNLGQADVASLVSALQRACDRGLDIGSTLSLESYFSDRYPANHAMLGVCDKLHKLYSNDFTPIVLARTLGVNVLNQLSFVKDLMVQTVSGKVKN